MRKRDLAASFPLLGLLSYGPSSGYELKKLAARTISFFWQDGFAQIYTSLRLFESVGYVHRLSPDTNGPRKVITYDLTQRGREAFIAWLEEPVSSFAPKRHELLAKLFFGHMVKPAIATMHLEQYLALQEIMLKELGTVHAQLDKEVNDHEPGKPYWQLTVDHGIAIATALKAWTLSGLEHTRKAGED